MLLQMLLELDRDGQGRMNSSLEGGRLVPSTERQCRTCLNEKKRQRRREKYFGA